MLKKIANITGVNFKALKIATPNTSRLKRLRIGMYQRYYGGNMDEGWTRFVLEQFDFPYTSIMDKEIKLANLNKKYDVIILPHDNEGMIMGQIPKSYRRYLSSYPPQYRSGIGQPGVYPQQRGLVGGSHHNDGFGQPLAQVALQEIEDFSPALADKRNYVDIGTAVAGNHPQQHALADASSGEDAQSLSLAAGEQTVNGAHSHPQRLGYAATL